LTAAPSNLSLNPGGNATINIGVNRSNFSGPVTLTLSGQPNGVTGSFDPNPTSANSALSLSVGSGVGPGSYTLVIGGSGGGASAETRITLTVTAPQAPPPPMASLNGTLLTLFGVSGDTILCAEEIGITQNVLSSPFNFNNLPADRQYKLQGWKDVNGNGNTDAGGSIRLVHRIGQRCAPQRGPQWVATQARALRSTPTFAAPGSTLPILPLMQNSYPASGGRVRPA